MLEAVRAANRVQNYSLDQPRMARRLGNSAGMRYDLIADEVDSNLAAGLKLLARSDFDGALLMAESLEHPPLKLASIVAVAAVAFEKKESKAEASKKKN
jgi:hypothetical protein